MDLRFVGSDVMFETNISCVRRAQLQNKHISKVHVKQKILVNVLGLQKISKTLKRQIKPHIDRANQKLQSNPL